MSGKTEDKLVLMANQIARNMVHEPHAVAAVADHIHAFWSARMKSQLFAHLAHVGDAGLHPIARGALAELAAGHCPPHQTRATDPLEQGADGG